MTKEEIINEAVFPRHDPENGASHAVSFLQTALYRINTLEG